MSEGENILRPEYIPHIEAFEKKLAELPDSDENKEVRKSLIDLINSLRKLASLEPIKRLRTYSTFGRPHSIKG